MDTVIWQNLPVREWTTQLRALRERRKKKWNEVATATGLDNTTVRVAEEIGSSKITTLERIVEALEGDLQIRIMAKEDQPQMTTRGHEADRSSVSPEEVGAEMPTELHRALCDLVKRLSLEDVAQLLNEATRRLTRQHLPTPSEPDAAAEGD